MDRSRHDSIDQLRPLLGSETEHATTRSGPDDYDIDTNFEFGGLEGRETVERSLLRKLDARMSILILIYILNYIDRNNAAAARLRGFQDDLHLTDPQFATILSSLYIGYILMQIPSNMYLNRAGNPSKYLPFCMIIWGGISICTGFTTSYLAALCTRFFLGFVEAAFFPGALFLISKWYKRTELSQRMAFLSCGMLISNAFGALIASGILNSMDGILGYTAWRWLFFVEGSLTVLVAISAIYILPDFPETSSGWLTPAEKNLAIRRLAEEYSSPAGGPVAGDKTNHWVGLSLAISDKKVWCLAFGLMSMVVSLSFNAYFPTLCGTLGYGPTVTLLLCAPPWVFATLVSLWVSRHSDRQGERCLHIVVPLCIGILGFGLSMFTMNIVVRYMSLFLMAQSYAGFICFLAWASSSVSQPTSKRAVALALINCISQLGNVLGSYVWPSSWGPSYNASYSICIFSCAVCIMICFWFQKHLAWLNMKEDKRDVEDLDGVVHPGCGYRYML